MKQFAGKVAVITGAASGFGRAFACHAAGLGMKLVLADVAQDALEILCNELRGQGADVLPVACDVRCGDEVQSLADAAFARHGVVHLLFNNAGVGSGGLIWEHSAADWEWLLGVNLFGVVHGVRIFTPLMLDCGRRDADYRGHIVNTASVAGLYSAPLLGAYNVSKHAVVALSETLFQDLRLIEAPVGASVLCPHFVPTAIHQSERSRPPQLRNPERASASQRAAQALTDKAVKAGTLSAEEVARLTFAAICEGRFYIHTHPQALAPAAARMDEVIKGENPADPYAEAPQLKAMLQRRLAQ